MFRFRLQQVLDLREQHERELASQLVRALGAEREAQAHLDGLRAARDTSTERGGEASRSVGELAHLALILEQIDSHIATANDAVAAAGASVAQAKVALATAFQDRRVLDRLREREAESHRAAAEHVDRRTMDEIALVRYTQNSTP